MKPSISCNDLSKTYRLYSNPWHRLLETMPWQKEKMHREVHALRHVSFEVSPGTCVGLVGGNGAGKSTLLKVLTGTTAPTWGSYTLRGQVASLLELGAGFNQGFTGRENVYMNAALMGLTRKEAKSKFAQILEFSELGKFIDAPLRTYSSGMICRLGFSVAVAADPDVLIIDEILAVGDMHFRRKCVERIMDYKERGKTMFFCSHSLYDIRQICEQTIWLKDGELKMYDDSIVVTNEYATYENTLSADLQDAEPWNTESGRPRPKPVDGDDQPRIVSACLVDPRTRQKRNTFCPREDIAVRVHIRGGKLYEPLNVAVGFARADGTLCLAMTTEFDGVLIEASEAVVTLLLPEVKLLSGEFAVPVWLLDRAAVHRFHERPCEANLVIQNRDRELGLFLCERKWQIDVLRGPDESAQVAEAEARSERS